MRVATRAQAVSKVISGAVSAAVIIPPGIAARLASDVDQAQLEVLYNGDALEQSLVHSTLDSAIAQANLGFSEQIQQAAASVIGTLVQGGSLPGIGAPGNLIGLSQIPSTLGSIVAHQPRGRDRTELERIDAFAAFADQNLSLAKHVLATISQPIRVKSTLLHGRRTPLNTFAVVVAVSVSLMFVCVLLAAGGVALEREEHVLARLIRSAPGGGVGGVGGPLISRSGLLAEKTLLAAGCSFALAFAMLAGIGAFVALDWSRVGEWLAALAFGALAFGALGVAIGALAREVRAASLLAFLLSLPLAFLALVPAGVGLQRLRRRDQRDLVRVPLQGRAAGARCGRQRRLAGDRAVARAPRRPDAAVRCARARGAAARRVSELRAPPERRRRSHQTISRGVSSRAMAFPQTRMRRLRSTAGLRGLVRETDVRAAQLVLPLFVTEADGVSREPIATMPGVDRLSLAAAVGEAREAAALGIAAVMLFGLPAEKDEHGSGAWDQDGVVQLADARDQAGRPRSARDHRRVPVRVHRPRALRRAARRRIGRQRRDARAARADCRRATRAPAPTSSRRRT